MTLATWGGKDCGGFVKVRVFIEFMGLRGFERGESPLLRLGEFARARENMGK
jgi:hypothetical protein